MGGTDAGSVVHAGPGPGSTGGGGGISGSRGGTSFYGRPDSTVDGNRPPGSVGNTPTHESTGGPGFVGGAGSDAGSSGGGGGGGSAGSNPIGGVNIGQGTNVDEFLRAQGAKRTKKQKVREKTY
jgi:hypothetical protein